MTIIISVSGHLAHSSGTTTLASGGSGRYHIVPYSSPHLSLSLSLSRKGPAAHGANSNKLQRNEEIEISKLGCLDNKPTKVVFPAPDGEDKIIITPSFTVGI